MTDKDDSIHSLSELERDIWMELKDQDTILSFTNKAMVEVDNPHKGVTFLERERNNAWF